MKLSNKHAKPFNVSRSDFSGGLNTTNNVDGITETQLAQGTNVEVDHSTHRLKSVSGTVDVFTSEEKIFAAMFDDINKKFLLVYEDKTVRSLEPATLTLSNSLGKLTGNLYPIYTAWEDGILIASGGNLQYFDGANLKIPSYDDSDDLLQIAPKAKSVYIRAGRVLITDDEKIKYSAVGDEGNWIENDTDDSSSKWIEAGYKDGGNFIGMANLSQDILLIKNNRRVYRLSGEFPNWQINEVSRNVECSGRLSYCAVADSVFILGKNEVQVIQTTESYGDVKPTNVASLITKEIQKLPENAIVRFVPPLSQVWFIGKNGIVLMFDTTVNAWYKREFNSEIIDVISIGDEVFVVKADRISKLDEGTFYDNGLPLRWNFQAQRLVSQHDYLLKRTQIAIIPLSANLYSGQIWAGAVRVPFPIPARSIKIYQNNSPIYKTHAKICLSARRKFVYVSGEKIFDNPALIYGNEQKIFGRLTMIRENRNVFRSKFIDIRGNGSGGGFLLNGIILDIAEV